MESDPGRCNEDIKYIHTVFPLKRKPMCQMLTSLSLFAGIGSEEVQPFSMSLEAEMMLEQLKEQHLQEMEDLRKQLESKVSLLFSVLWA